MAPALGPTLDPRELSPELALVDAELRAAALASDWQPHWETGPPARIVPLGPAPQVPRRRLRGALTGLAATVAAAALMFGALELEIGPPSFRFARPIGSHPIGSCPIGSGPDCHQIGSCPTASRPTRPGTRARAGPGAQRARLPHTRPRWQPGPGGHRDERAAHSARSPGRDLPLVGVAAGGGQVSLARNRPGEPRARKRAVSLTIRAVAGLTERGGRW